MSSSIHAHGVLAFLATTLFTLDLTAAEGDSPKDDGYRGIWYYNQPTKDEYKYKYSGGMATYPQQHAPIAIYSKQANKTFFCYGGTTTTGKRSLLHMIAYYDHATGTVPRPTILLDKQTDDAHDNPTMQIDDDGHIWIFSSSHGAGRPSYIHRSSKPSSRSYPDRLSPCSRDWSVRSTLLAGDGNQTRSRPVCPRAS